MHKYAGERPPFSRLVYPVPEEHGLGVHATIDIAGGTRFGPDTEWIEPSGAYGDDAFDASVRTLPHWSKQALAPGQYAVDSKRSRSFVEEIRKYWPALPDDALYPDYSGVRPKLVGEDPSEAVARASALPFSRDLRDFVVEGPALHGVAGLVNLFGIESPGLTSCLSIAEHVVDLLQDDMKWC
jgi:L-2-hydroxyglutarate oxidase LhgO